ncbi:DcrB-related protein [Citrobacter sedlakii]|uniref:DcrB-related protein n=1 Tax=Citrobacter TaxID=544 RepID=UPI00196A12D1|nr:MULTISPECIES: DcrB-related protein [Citrobacter]MBM9568698.1 DcrB-related protein [Citrobacter sedlakii]MEB0950809.1 DcrB-related protein [Citrobacter sedlakii]HBL4689841.1 DcrB-related protein [Citrobacter sedlakii]HBL4704280.1 DcrB-related protein [Citrobacter sedlakii]HBL4719029.1 DcrB-related protein [Citrobacter sedlakii]
MNTLYRMNEGHLALTGEDWLDCTMQVIRNTRTHTSLVITRAFIPEDRTFDDELTFQWAQVAAQINNFQQTPPVVLTLPLLPDCPARETAATYLREPHFCCQRQLAVLMPERRLLMLTCTVLNAFSEEDERFWQQVKNTLDRD